MITDSNRRATGCGSCRREPHPMTLIVYRKNQDVDISQFTSWFLYCIAGNLLLTRLPNLDRVAAFFYYALFTKMNQNVAFAIKYGTISLRAIY